MHYQKQETQEVLCELRVYIANIESHEMKVRNESGELLKNNPDVDVMMEAQREMESVTIKEDSLNLSFASLHTTNTRSG